MQERGYIDSDSDSNSSSDSYSYSGSDTDASDDDGGDGKKAANVKATDFRNFAQGHDLLHVRTGGLAGIENAIYLSDKIKIAGNDSGTKKRKYDPEASTAADAGHGSTLPDSDKTAEVAMIKDAVSVVVTTGQSWRFFHLDRSAGDQLLRCGTVGGFACAHCYRPGRVSSSHRGGKKM